MLRPLQIAEWGFAEFGIFVQALNASPVLCLARTLGKCQKRQKSSADEGVFTSAPLLAIYNKIRRAGLSDRRVGPQLAAGRGTPTQKCLTFFTLASRARQA